VARHYLICINIVTPHGASMMAWTPQAL